MRSLSKSSIAIIAYFVCRGDAAVLVERQDANLMVPIVAEPSQHWEGVDGTWSTFSIRVGTPETTYRVLPATSWQETWVVYGAAADVCNTTVGVRSNCQDDRGGVFDSASSKTWQQGDQYQLQLDSQFGYEGVGQYGFDTVGLGLSNATGPSLSHQIVAEVVTDSWWFGMLGLGFQPTNFTGYGNPQASFSDTLYSNKTISSMSWSYTAGASYRLKSVFGSLIFGGYDASKFTPNPIRFTMAPDNLRDLVVTVRSVTSTTSSGNTTILSDPIFAYIDSAVPEFYLPASACQAFEKAFNLTLDTASGLYLIDTATNNRLTALNPSVVFTLANQKTGGATTDITLPYSAFALNASTPFLQNHPSSLYFPLKQAPDENNYVLGRAFLQEAHVSTHYNSRTFNVSQAVFSDSATPSIVALPAVLASSATSSTTPSSSTDPRNHSKKKKGLGGGAIAGIVIGALAALALIALLAFLLLRRRKRSSATSTAASSPHRKPSGPVHEIDTGKRVDPGTTSAYTAQASAMTSEVSGKDSHVEKWGVPIMHPQELEADVPVAAAGRNEERHKSLSPVRENGRTPMAELGIEERGLGVAQHSEPRTAGYEQQREDDDIVSPNTDRSGSGRVSRRFGGSGSDRTSGRQSPVSEGTWTPTTPVVRKGSRFEERWNE